VNQHRSSLCFTTIVSRSIVITTLKRGTRGDSNWPPLQKGAGIFNAQPPAPAQRTWLLHAAGSRSEKCKICKLLKNVGMGGERPDFV
jgi:hypothetical protein